MTASSLNKKPSSTIASSPLQMLRSRKPSSSTQQSHGTTLAQKRLTRAKQLRYLSDQDVGLDIPHRPESSSWVSQDPSDGFEFRCSSAVPHPLPLPDRFSPNASSGFGRTSTAHPPSATNVTRSPEGCRRRHIQDLIDKNMTCIPKLNDSSKNAPITGLPASPVESSGWFNQDPNVKNVSDRCRPKVAAKSAPASSLSSPTTSPRRPNGADMFPSSVPSQEYCNRRTLDASNAGDLAGLPLQVSPPRGIFTPDHSPAHSPKVGRPLNSRSLDELTFPSLHHRLAPGTSIERPNNNSHVNAHPLPLPPKTSLMTHSSMSTQLASTHQTTENLYVPFTKGQWQKGKLIGQGTFGRVYLATNRQTGASCAMKEVDIIPDDPKSAECIKQLEQEIKVLSQLEHPNIVQYYGTEIVDDQLYIYLEYVFPGSINKYIREHCGAMTEPVVRSFTRHILMGLAYLHSKKTVHRDIKGANLLVNASGEVKLADFGLAKHLTGQAYDLSLKGSPYWMAPEIMQATTLKDASPDLAFAVDIWSLGCTIIEMFTGKPPWSESEGHAAMFRVLNETPAIPEILSPEGKDFLRCCFRRDPAERPSASWLLEHPFLQNSHERNVSFCTQSFCTMKLLDKPRSPTVNAKSKVAMPSQGMQNTNRSPLCYREACQQMSSPLSARAACFRHNPFSSNIFPSETCQRNSSLVSARAACFHHNPFSTQVFQSPSRTQVNSPLHKVSLPTNSLCNTQLGTLSDHLHLPPSPKTHQPESPHL